MDANLPDVDAHIDLRFSAAFPLGLRIVSLVSFGAFCWASDLHILALLGIDTGSVLDVRLPELAHHRTTSAGAAALHAAETASTLRSYAHPASLYPPIYHLALTGFAWTALGLALFQVYGAHGESTTGRTLPALFLFGVLVALFMPFDRLKRRERFMLLRSLRRTMFDPITAAVPFCDVILADVLTSFAKVLGDIWLCGAIALGIDAREGWSGRWGVPLMTALPYFFRFRQCISEHLNAPAASYTPLSHSTSSTTPASAKKRSLCNALKYATAFPVILSSAMQGAHADLFHDSGAPDETGLLSRTGLFRIWVIAVLVNSLYSFWWDVTNDWGLGMLLPSTWSAGLPSTSASGPAAVPLMRSSSPPSPLGANRHYSRPHARKASQPVRLLATVSNGDAGDVTPRPGTPSHQHHSTFPAAPGIVGRATSALLRPVLLLPDPLVYFIAVAIDLLLRLTWSLKLSSHLHQVHELEQGVYLLEILEIVRRQTWVVLRCEWEALRRGGDGSHLTHAESFELADDAYRDANGHGDKTLDL